MEKERIVQCSDVCNEEKEPKKKLNWDYDRVKLTQFLILVEVYKKQEFKQIHILEKTKPNPPKK